ncbi:MAG: cytochrome c [Akkermansiaceae bacterium]|nr:cytochrome c [Akkermansiaceae bacterium]
MTPRAIRASLTVAAVYAFFLIFAQFSFVELMRRHGVSHAGETTFLGMMAAAGIACGFFAARVAPDSCFLRAALAIAAVCGGVAPFCAHSIAFGAVALLTGAALGAATVWTAALLPSWCGVFWAGLGTGVGYAVCNIPVIFTSPPETQAMAGAVFAAIGAVAVPNPGEETQDATRTGIPVWAMIAVFTALVWLDSAAFFIIQHSANLKSGTWGDLHLWRNAAVHLVFAVLAGWMLSRGWLAAVAGSAWGVLAVAAFAVNGAETRHLAGWIYPAAVSLYSTALIAWPGWFSGARDIRSAAWRAAWVFAIAGWFGSANGIGMAGSLRHVPAAFVLISGIVVAAVLWIRRGGWQAVVSVVAVAAAAWATQREKPRSLVDVPDAFHGREVYLSEGCIHCHSRYVRPGSPDEAIWGAATPLDEVTSETPVLIGNRRQGPDLANVGARRSEAWLREHFLHPRLLAPDSVMPSYAHLFRDNRGEDLVAYLRQSGLETLPQRMRTIASWSPSETPSSDRGPELFLRHCAACHGATGGGDGPLAAKFIRPPANLIEGPFIWTADGPDHLPRIMRVIKFGIPGTDMPGHEVLRDADIRALADEVLELRAN